MEHVFMSALDIISKIGALNNISDDYWDFRGTENSARDFVHDFCAYPAMMVPKMQRELLKICVQEVDSKNISLLDPFAGSGTLLVESMLLGINVTGIDINPLAILLCKAKTTIIAPNILKNSTDTLIRKVKDIDYQYVTHTFSGIEKWFTAQAIKDLSKIRAAILQETSIEMRRFFWAAFCEVVRLVSNSRHCTYKLHIKEQKDIDSYNKDALQIFEKVLNHNIESYHLFYGELENRKLLNRKGLYKGKVKIHLGDTLEILKSSKNKFDLLFTSPPYGDNHTTVSYGQFSVLPLRWIKYDDIDENVDMGLLETLSMIDRKSLGGKTSQASLTKKVRSVISRSNALAEQIKSIEAKDCSKVNKIILFYSDFNKALKIISQKMKPISYQVWTVGNRKVAKQEIYMHKILEDLNEEFGFSLVLNFNRNICNKRMPEINAYKGNKEDYIETMTKEQILIFKKG